MPVQIFTAQDKLPAVRPSPPPQPKQSQMGIDPLVEDSDSQQPADPSLRSKISATIRRPSIRLCLLLVLHSVLFTLTYAFAFFARFNFDAEERHFSLFWATLAPVVITKLVVFYLGSHFHGWWRYVTFADLRALLKVSMASMIVVAFVDYFALAFTSQIPRLSIVLDALVTVIVIGGLRSSWRFVDELFGTTLTNHKKRPAVLVGVSQQIGQLASQINANQLMPCRVTALLATHSDYRRKALMGGIPVLGHIDDVVKVAARVEAKEVLVPAGTLDGRELRRLTELCNSSDLSVRVLPRFEDAMEGTEKIPLRHLDINDLLRRDPVKLDTAEVEELIRGKRVLITGAGGSIGSEICRQVLPFRPATLVLLGRGENRIHAIHSELREAAEESGVELLIEIGDITDRPRMERLFETRQPEIVFHAAAHKHVPLMELHPCEAVKNNIHGTKVIASLADEHSVGYFVMVSTDKAVNPTSIMGCSKQLAERVVYDLAQTSKTKFAVVRFGNVLGSAGSVIPVFQEQIRRGGPITITEPQMTRYFMSIPEASQLVIQAATQCRGGEIFVLDMGKPVKIVQLAEDLVTLSGLPKGSIEFVFTGIRAGEKMYEELYFDDETTIPTKHPKVRAAYASDFQSQDITSEIETLIKMSKRNDPQIRKAITNLVPSYQGDCKSPAINTTTEELKPVPTPGSTELSLNE